MGERCDARSGLHSRSAWLAVHRSVLDVDQSMKLQKLLVLLAQAWSLRLGRTGQTSYPRIELRGHGPPTARCIPAVWTTRRARNIAYPTPGASFTLMQLATSPECPRRRQRVMRLMTAEVRRAREAQQMLTHRPGEALGWSIRARASIPGISPATMAAYYSSSPTPWLSIKASARIERNAAKRLARIEEVRRGLVERLPSRR